MKRHFVTSISTFYFEAFPYAPIPEVTSLYSCTNKMSLMPPRGLRALWGIGWSIVPTHDPIMTAKNGTAITRWAHVCQTTDCISGSTV